MRLRRNYPQGCMSPRCGNTEILVIEKPEKEKGGQRTECPRGGMDGMY